MRRLIIAAVLCAFLDSGNVLAQQSTANLFSDLIGDATVQPVSRGRTMQVPFITWGADVAAFHANGGITRTQPTSIYGKQGLSLNFYDGNDFVKQVRDYLSGKTPFLRGTMRMIGQASEVVGSDARTKPVVIAQLSWSMGDHIVSRSSVKRLDDLKGKRIACQQGGPHVGLLYDALQSVQLNENDVEIVWVADLTGAGGPADAFKNDASIDACCVITPDMVALTGGIDSVGTGAETSVKGAYVLNSTQQMTGSIADVYAVRSDWLENNHDTARRFVAGFLRATEEVRNQRDKFDESGRLNNDYKKTLQFAQTAFGKQTIRTLEEDAHGLLLDCEFARLTGQIDFFEGIYDSSGNLRRNPIGFAAKSDASLLLAKNWGYAARVMPFDHAKWDYESIAKLANLKYVRPKQANDAPAKTLRKDVASDRNTIYSFDIGFQEDQETFSVEDYEQEFQRAIDAVALYKNAIVVIQGHSDSGGALSALMKAGIKKKLLKKVNGKWTYQGRPLSLDRMVDLIRSGKFGGANVADDPAVIMQKALTLSLERASEVKNVIVDMAQSRGIALDARRMAPDGAGISNPVYPVPRSKVQSQANRRVEFRVIRVVAERVDEEDYDLLKDI